MLKHVLYLALEVFGNRGKTLFRRELSAVYVLFDCFHAPTSRVVMFGTHSSNGCKPVIQSRVVKAGSHQNVAFEAAKDIMRTPYNLDP